MPYVIRVGLPPGALRLLTMIEFPLDSWGDKPPLSEFPISDQVAMHLAEDDLSLHAQKDVMSQGPPTKLSLMNL